MRQHPRLKFAIKLQSVSMEDKDESCPGMPALQRYVSFY